MRVEIITAEEEYGDIDLPMLFPFFLKISENETVLQIYEDVYESLRFVEELREDEIFSEQVCQNIVSVCDSFLSRRGYSLRYGRLVRFAINDRNNVNKSLVLDSSEVLLEDHGYECLVDVPSEELSEGFICFGTVLDGKIVSVATENPHDEDATSIDIGVDTAEGYRGRGYAASNVASLVYYLLDTGVTVTYTVEDGNLPSIALAEKVGFKRSGRFFQVFGTRLSDDEESSDNVGEE